MQVHALVDHLASLMGCTFDDAFVVVVWFSVACIGGSGFILSIGMEIGFYVLDIVRRLLRKLFRTARRLLKVHFQKH